ncbi:MAG TPA: ABC transporter substrate-binding protein [Candidatus Ornithospirochaeta stercorigallinarum]|nr:ABC transporter substrate-binding protein [Candidatus Ornithospirochaeta stercorigallinarum]
MKRIIITLFVLLSTFSSFSEGVREDYAHNKVYKIGISKLLAHPALDAIEEGIKDYLDSTDYAFEYDVQNANGEVTAASQIAQVFKDEGTDLNIGIATPTAQALANVCVDTPLIYSSVTNPTAAGLVGKGMENIAGVSDMVPVAAHLSLIMQIVPELESLGMVYTSGEANGIVLMEAMKAAAEDEGVDLITASVANSSEVRMAAESIIDRVDAVYVATDNTVISAITALSDVCMAHRIPLFSADTTSSYGTDVLLAGGFDYYASGLLTGEIVERYLEGENLEDIGVVYLDQESLEIYLNMDVASALGLTIPETIADSAAIVVSGGRVEEV